MGYTEDSALARILDELMQAVYSNQLDKVNALSSAYQRIKSVQTKEEQNNERK